MNPLNLLLKNRELKQQLEQLRPRLYRLAFSWSQNHALSDDLTQDTIIKALKNYQQLNDTKKLDSWAFSILHNCYCDYFRQNKNFDDIDNYEFEDGHQPDTDYEHNSVTHAVRAAVNKLPTNQCQVLTLIDLEGFSYAEVSQILDIPIGTVMSRLCRARQTLTSKLLDYSDKTQPVNLRRIK
ncbi:MAG: RNA polymerase sigma factor [Gammaproteobacteria bacterium]|nr:RNA polymerase sigma factor [Gammaproteobacteria bacterium]